MLRRSITQRGIIAGTLAGTTIVLWFLIADLTAGLPFRTPAFLTYTLFGLDEFEPAVGPIALYTLLHFLAFIAIGYLAAKSTRRLHPRAYILVGLVLGFFLFDLLFYGSLIVTGINILEALGWPLVLSGNLLAGVVLMEYLRFTGPMPAPGWSAFLRENAILRRGLIGGILGASAVAISFLIIDTLFREALFTPGALGSVLIHQASDPAGIEITAATVLTYTLLHYIAFVLIGTAAAALITRVEDHPALLLGIILVFVTFEALFIGIVAIFAAWILDTIGWWNVLIGNLIATITMVGYLAREHPLLWRFLSRKEPLEAPR